MMRILVATAECEVHRGKASAVIAPSVDGELKILPNHTPLLAILRPGILRIDCPPDADCAYGRRDEMVVFGGFIEVQGDAVVVLADAVEREEQIDADLAERAAQKARGMLQSSDIDTVDRALLDLELAIARLRVARKNSKKSFMQQGGKY